ncbi:MAG: divergent polysaccharide deacetylase family protein [Deltaproteobacteria bacterium]
MNTVKNAVIIVLSVIVLVQAAALLYVLRHTERPSPASSPAPAFLEVPAAPEAPAGPSVAPQAVPQEPAVPVEGQIVLILDDWGYNVRNRSFIVDNDFHVTLSVLPFKPYSEVIAKLAYDKGKDVIVHMPMEPHDKQNYGLEEKMLAVGMRPADAVAMLDGAFASVPFAKGLSNHMGSRATEDPALMRTVLTYLKKKDLFFVDSLVTPKSVCAATARRLGVAFTQRDVFIDNEEDAGAIRARLDELAQKARTHGIAVGIGHDRPLTIRVLDEEIPRLEREGIRFINVSDALKERP